MFYHQKNVRGWQTTPPPLVRPRVKISPYRKPTQPRKYWPHHWGLLFSNSGVGSFTSHKNQLSESAVRWDLQFIALIRED